MLVVLLALLPGNKVAESNNGVGLLLLCGGVTEGKAGGTTGDGGTGGRVLLLPMLFVVIVGAWLGILICTNGCP
jgi:hypothetical protein